MHFSDAMVPTGPTAAEQWISETKALLTVLLVYFLFWNVFTCSYNRVAYFGIQSDI